MKDDVVRLQQEQVTIMTQGQWNFNVIKQWMTATNDAMGFEAQSSSVYSSINQFGPTFVTDGEVSSKTTCSFTPTLGTRGFSRVRREFSVLAEATSGEAARKTSGTERCFLPFPLTFVLFIGLHLRQSD